MKESGFIVKKLLLLESSFSRVNQVEFDEKKIKSSLNINPEVSVEGKQITVVETVSLTQKVNEVPQVTATVKMVGVFEANGISEIKDLNTFGKINGAAIIFPYIREHISNLSLKAGLGNLVLPLINFVDKK